MKAVRKAVSRLPESLVGGVDAKSSDSLPLKALIALDALSRGSATTSLLTLLAQQILISEQLCAAGYEDSKVELVRKAYIALVHVYSDASPDGGVGLGAADYEALREALIVYDTQLSSAPRCRVRDAELATVARLIRRLAKTAN
ncbi:hypothetical protein [Burkholderia sp. 8Y]|uniref:hypothetical protein n=1 Tax=Burkholderia sp. 8Y TaxID=2653133 RepID=UPI00135B293E|nr:hypothetical protein [Burkholderia sp. 8Y]